MGNPDFGAVKQPAVLNLRGAAGHGSGVGAMVGLGEPKAAKQLALGHGRKVFLALGLGAVGKNGQH